MNQNKIKVTADSVIPFLKGVLEPYADIQYIPGIKIKHEDIIDSDALVIRTRTVCNKEFLEGTAVKLICTATIGTDHIDLDYCKQNGIEVRNAAGCNAGGVMDYVFSALYGIASRKSISLDNAVFGIIGVGNVGSRIEKMAKYLGFKVLRNDPPRAEAEGEEGFCSLDYLLEHADIITMHTPLNPTTENMANEHFFSKMKEGAIFMNSGRGEVVCEDALLNAIPKLGAVVIDTWRNEPNISQELLDAVDIATPHIAGYSLQGKLNGTSAAVRAFAEFYDIDELKDFYSREEKEEYTPIKLDLENMNQGEIASVLQYNYPIFTDDFMFRMEPGLFEKMRSEYQYRREFYVV